MINFNRIRAFARIINLVTDMRLPHKTIHLYYNVKLLMKYLPPRHNGVRLHYSIFHVISADYLRNFANNYRTHERSFNKQYQSCLFRSDRYERKIYDEIRIARLLSHVRTYVRRCCEFILFFCLQIWYSFIIVGHK